MGAITSVPMLFSGSESQSTYIQQAINGVDFGQILSEIISVAPDVLPTIITIIAFKKALRWVIGSVKGA
jgi:hypothetical protein